VLPVVGEKTWSAWELTKDIPGMVTPKPKDPKPWDNIKVDVNFKEILKKILPKKSAAGQPEKMSPVFILGILVPVAFFLTYGLLVLAALTAVLRSGRAFKKLAGFSVLTAGYGLGGAYYLGQIAQHNFQASMEKASQGILGVVTKNFVQEIVFEPGYGIYALFMIVVVICLFGLTQVKD